MDDLDALRGLYSYLRRHPSVLVRGRAYVMWQRLHGKRPTTFIVSGTGECWPNDRPALLAEYRTMLLQAGFPPAFVARWDLTTA